MILLAYGTRPEIIKLFPLVHELEQQHIPFQTLFTGQHLDLYQDVKNLMPEPDYCLENFSNDSLSLAGSFCQIASSVEKIISNKDFKLIIVQGDTTTACAIAEVAFYNQIKVAHVEAGLRTYDTFNPFPEEVNRRIISQVADINFAPTEIAFQNLKKEGARNIFLTGNTIVDALKYFKFERKYDQLVLITIHRRENHKKLPAIFTEINCVASKLPEIDFIFPIHPNPNVQRHKTLLKGKNIHVIKPVGYQDMLKYISSAKFIISDSGGLQEEAVYFGKKILIIRKTTERPETIETGLGRLVDLKIVENLKWALVRPDVSVNNPFGDGQSCIKIIDIIKNRLY
ncbi:UDP-N-acetylglucosamine 2-epimerase (non-hydrolysing) [Candidatus Magnetomoraceae bacterium gMMP-15]